MSVAPDSTKTRPTREQARPAHPRRRLVAVLLFLLILVGGSFWWMNRGGVAHEGIPAEGAPAATSPDLAVRVDVVQPRAGGLVRQTSQPGSIHAFESVDMYAKVSGFLEKQVVDIGDVVKADQVLAEIESPELEKDVDEASAAVEQARTRAALAEARVATAEAERDAVAASLVEAEADIAQRVANRSLSEKQLDRIKGLHARNAVEKVMVDEQEHDYESALAGERSARAALLTAKAQLSASEAKIAQAKAEVAEARAAITFAEARLGRARVIRGYSKLVAPFDGVVTARHFHPGAFILSAADGTSVPLLTIKRTDRMRVVVQVPDLDVALLDVGDKAKVTIDALKGKSFEGAVSRIAHAENPTTRTMRVEIDLDNPSGLLCEGMYGHVTIELRPPSQGLSLPAGCILGHTAGGQAKVFVVRDGKVHAAKITPGDDDGTTTEILSGLDTDDAVVLNPRGVSEDDGPVVANLIPPADKPH